MKRISYQFGKQPHEECWQIKLCMKFEFQTAKEFLRRIYLILFPCFQEAWLFSFKSVLPICLFNNIVCVYMSPIKISHLKTEINWKSLGFQLLAGVGFLGLDDGVCQKCWPKLT